MNIGIPKEIKSFEGRVALTPSACADLILNGHIIYIEHDAGLLSGFSDESYRQVGAVICMTAKTLFDAAELIVKVKEPLDGDLRYLKARHILFCFLHLAANVKLANKLAEIGLTAVAFESVRENNRLPLLMPMSQIAGKLAVQIGATLLHQYRGGTGVLLGGLNDAATDSGQVLVLGAGSAGTQAALLAHQMGANVYIYDKYPAALERISQINDSIKVIMSERECRALVSTTNLMIGALLIPGKKTPRFIHRSDLQSMEKGSVVVDISVDQGGCFETTRPTTYEDPTFIEEGVVHFCVANMPGAVPRTATQALSALLPAYIHRLTLNNWYENDKIMRQAVNVKESKLLIGL